MAICYSVKLAAKETGLSERTIHAYIKEGKLKVVRVGRRILIMHDDLIVFLRGE